MMTIKAEVTAGESISNAFVEAIALADKLDCYVEFNFNGVMCIANPGGNPKKGAEGYHDSIRSEAKYKFAMS